MLTSAYLDKLKSIPISEYLKHHGYVPAKSIGAQLVYLSPLTGEKSPSFFVNPQKNVFNCFSSGHKGDIITLVEQLEAIDFKAAISVLQSFSSSAYSDNYSRAVAANLPGQPAIPAINQFTSFDTIKILAVKTLSNRVLINYLRSRGIYADLAAHYLKEAYFRVQGKDLFALALTNDKGGYELRNTFYKGCALAKAPTTVKGKLPQGKVNLFEGVFDFLSALAYYKTDSFKNDSIILSSLWLFDTFYQNKLIESYTHFNLFLDNDRAGWKKAIEFRRKLPFLNRQDTFQNQSVLYKGYKDFNLFWINSLHS